MLISPLKIRPSRPAFLLCTEAYNAPSQASRDKESKKGEHQKERRSKGIITQPSPLLGRMMDMSQLPVSFRKYVYTITLNPTHCRTSREVAIIPISHIRRLRVRGVKEFVPCPDDSPAQMHSPACTGCHPSLF